MPLAAGRELHTLKLLSSVAWLKYHICLKMQFEYLPKRQEKIRPLFSKILGQLEKSKQTSFISFLGMTAGFEKKKICRSQLLNFAPTPRATGVKLIV